MGLPTLTTTCEGTCRAREGRSESQHVRGREGPRDEEARGGTHDVGDDVAARLMQARVDLGHVVLLVAVADREEAERLGVDGRVGAEDVEHDLGRRAVVARTDNHAVADDHEELALVVVLELGERVDARPQRLLALGVARDLACAQSNQHQPRRDGSAAATTLGEREEEPTHR